MEKANFGSVLREERERRQLSLSHVADKTKLPQLTLKLLEDGRLQDLPPEVFVRGFIRSYAKAIGMPDAEPIALFEQAVMARTRAQAALLAMPLSVLPTGEPVSDDEAAAPRRGIGLAVFVIIVLLIATITLSLFMRQPPESGERLSLTPVPTGLIRSLPAREG